jgi:tetratricopeptide (TPR) repeat protein
MGLMKLFSGRSSTVHEQKGDRLFEKREYGLAKGAYENALDKLGGPPAAGSEVVHRLREKIIRSTEALARQLVERAEEIFASEYYEEAEESFRLARGLTQNAAFRREIEERLELVQTIRRKQQPGVSSDDISLEGEETEDKIESEEDEYFRALCAAFPRAVREAYGSYGEDFKTGYVALNQGRFELAVDKLSQALEENAENQGYIPLELATAYLNLQNYKEARALILGFVHEHPDVLQGYQVLCETLWGLREYDLAERTLLSAPQELAASLPVRLLRGENLYQAGGYQEAVSLYLDDLERFGWDEHLARSLARAYEALGEKEKALGLYARMMRECGSCGVRIDPFIKQRFADLSFETGRQASDILELYLSLAQEDPENRGRYYRRVSEIYAAQGNEEQAKRFETIAEEVV